MPTPPILQILAGHATPKRGLAKRLLSTGVLGLMLLPLGCTSTGAAQFDRSPEEFGITIVAPQDSHPSARANSIFAQLMLDKAMLRNDKTAVMEAVDILLASMEALPPPYLSAPFIDAAIWLLAHDDEDAAMPIIQKASRYLPDDLPLVSLQADLLIQQNEREQAIALLHAFASKHPENALAQAELAQALLRSGRAEDAMEVFSRIPEKDLTPQIRFSYAQSLNAARKFSDAEAQLRAAVEADEEYAEAWQLLALTLEEIGKKKEALSIYQRLLDTSDDNRSARLFLMRHHLREGAMEKAVACVTESGDPLRFSVAAVAMLMDEKKADQAEDFLKRLEKLPDMPDGLYFYHAALLYESGGDLETALIHLSKVSEDSQEYDKAMRMKVRILYDLRRFEEAVAALEIVRRLHPDDAEPELLAAEIFCQMRDYGKAEDVLAKASAKYPDHADVAFQYAYLFEISGRHEKAVGLMEGVARRFPDHPLALNFVGYNLADAGEDLDRALALIVRAVELEPDADFILDSLAWVHYRRGEMQAAWENIQKAVDITSDISTKDPTMLEHYGDIALAVGMTTDAEKAWRQSLKTYLKLDMEKDAARVRQKLEKD